MGTDASMSCAGRRTVVAVVALAGLGLLGGPLVGHAGAVAPGPVVGRPASAAAPPNDPLFPAQWNLRAVGIPEAWRVTRGAGAVVAVLDTGVAYENDGVHHQAPDLGGTRFVPGWDFVDNDSHPDDEAPPGQPSHGTHMAGTIAQTTDNHLGAAGIAPDAAIMPIRVLSPDGSGTSAAISQGLRFAADHGANVANLSLGGEVGTRELQDAVAYATGKGVTVVVSAGDEGAPAVNFPAAFPGAIAVGAVRFDNTRAAYSDYGPRLDLVAPGGDLHVDQNGDGLDDGIVQQTLQGSPSNFCFCFKEGTSSAAAHVSGVAALVVASGRATTPSEVRRVLTETATDLGPPGRDDEYGAGLVQAAAALGIGPGVGTPSGTTTVRTSRSRPTSRASGTGPATAAVGRTHRRGPAHLFTSTHVPATPPEASHRLAARHAFVVVRRRARPTPRPHGPGGRSTVPNYLGRG